jgi:uronate dehydrogenase
VLITGAAGRIGRYLRDGLPPLGWQLRLLDIQPIQTDEDAVVADIRDADALDAAMEGMDAVVHLAGIASEAPFEDILDVNIEGSWHVFEAARRAGISRVVYASSNHAVGFTPRASMVGVDIPVRPDSYYGVSKVFGEALGRLYADRHAMSVVCLRIGSCFDRPTTPRMLSTWLTTPVLPSSTAFRPTPVHGGTLVPVGLLATSPMTTPRSSPLKSLARPDLRSPTTRSIASSEAGSPS